MVLCKCMSKERNEKGKTVSYVISDSYNNIEIMSPEEVKNKILTKQIEVVNLQIDKIGRLVDKSEDEVKRINKENPKEEAIDRHINSRKAMTANIKASDLSMTIKKLMMAYFRLHDKLVGEVLNGMKNNDYITVKYSLETASFESLSPEQQQKYIDSDTADDVVVTKSRYEVAELDDILMKQIFKISNEIAKQASKEKCKNVMQAFNIIHGNNLSYYYIMMIKDALNIIHNKYKKTVYALDFTYGLCEDAAEMQIISNVYEGRRFIIGIKPDMLHLDKTAMKHVDKYRQGDPGETLEEFVRKTCHFGELTDTSNTADDFSFREISDPNIGKLTITDGYLGICTNDKVDKLVFKKMAQLDM